LASTAPICTTTTLLDSLRCGTFGLDEIVEAHRCMEENKACGKIVVLT
jgi:hypothetical protein